MRPSQRCRFTLLAALLAVPLGQAWGQNVILDAPGLMPSKAKPGLPEVRLPPAVWPRLDPGAVLCRTEADLSRLAANRSGASDGGGPADCRIINVATGIQIMQRRGPGRTLVQVSGSSNQTGWTDAWLPEKAPPNAKSTASSR